MDSSRISALLQPFLKEPLPQSALNQISTYIDLLLRWNSRINLTAVRDAESIVTRHFGESFFLARHLFPIEIWTPPVGRTLLSAEPIQEPSRLHVLDIGSGAGFPGLPLKIWQPGISLTLIESNHKKATFLKEVARALTLTNVNVISERAEVIAAARIPNDIPPAHVVTLRAVERFEIILPVAARFLAGSAQLALLVGSSQLPALAALSLALVWDDPVPVPLSDSRVLVLGHRST